jgi:molybdopterin synthase sulfur carrier subunit
MSVSVMIPTALRAYADGNASITCAGATVGEALASLTEQHPGLSKHLRTAEGKLRSFVNVYLGEEDIRYLDGEATAVDAGAVLTIVPSIAGGVA